MEKGNVGAIHESPVLNVDKKGDVFQGASPLKKPRLRRGRIRIERESFFQGALPLGIPDGERERRGDS